MCIRDRENSRQLTNQIKHRIIKFFNWRLENKEPSELKKFTFWLEAECLPTKWRLESYSKILDICTSEGSSAYSEVSALTKMLGEHTTLVVECFTKLTKIAINNRDMYFQIDKTRMILQTGLASEDPNVKKNAERARENLLRRGHLELLDEKCE